MLRRLAALGLAFLLGLALPVPPASANEVREYGAFIQTIQAKIREGTDISDRLDRAGNLIDDYFYGELSEAVLRHEVTYALFRAERDLDAFREKLSDLPPMPRLTTPALARTARLDVEALGAFPDEIQLQLDTAWERMDAALEADVTRYERAAARSYRLAAEAVQSENLALGVSLETVSERHPQHALIEAVIASNTAHGLILGSTAESYVKPDWDFASISRGVLAALKRAQQAITQGRENVAYLKDPFRDAVVIDVLVAKMAEPQESEEARDLIERLADSYLRSFTIEEKLVGLLYELHDLLLEEWAGGFTDETIDTAEAEETRNFLEVTIPLLVDERIREDEERLDLALALAKTPATAK